MKIERELLKGHLPAIVLSVLEEEPMHGYGLCAKIRQRSGNALKLGEGTLYPLLYRLNEQGLLRAHWDKTQSSRPRKVYSLTSKGKRHLAAHKRQWVLLSGTMESIMGAGWATT
jgi:PadR family transcriptional regulator